MGRSEAREEHCHAFVARHSVHRYGGRRGPHRKDAGHHAVNDIEFLLTCHSRSITSRNSSNRFATLVVIALAPGCILAAPELGLPIACDIGSSCIVQNYVDRDAGPAARDYRCGFLTYDGHKGTDVRVSDRARYKDGVAVLAAAPGRVRAVRDGMADGERVAGREAGNSVVIQHGDGWETQYAHLRRGSVAVRAGDRVEAGGRPRGGGAGRESAAGRAPASVWSDSRARPSSPICTSRCAMTGARSTRSTPNRVPIAAPPRSRSGKPGHAAC